MKKTFLYLAAVAALLASCQSDDHEPRLEEPKDITLSRAETEMVSINNHFAFDFFKTITVNDEKDNIFVSPLSASLALSMIANGAANLTLEEMNTTLGFGQYTSEEINTYYQKLIAGLLATDPSTDIGIANSIWIKNGFPVHQSFIDLNKKTYDAEVRSLEFNQQAVNIINQWCSDKTNNRINKVLVEIDSSAKLFLINALYFKGEWVTKFDKGATTKETFTTINGQPKTVDMMHREGQILYIEDEGVQVVELPYGNEAYSMIVILPEENRSVDDVIAQLNDDKWNLWMETLSSSLVNIQLPKFKVNYEKMLTDDLIQMGIVRAFDEVAADFSQMSPEHLYLAFVKQQTFLEVNEAGTEAAAITIGGMSAASIDYSPKPIDFHVNRPFICAIKEKSTGVILFMGKIGSL